MVGGSKTAIHSLYAGQCEQIAKGETVLIYCHMNNTKSAKYNRYRVLSIRNAAQLQSLHDTSHAWFNNERTHVCAIGVAQGVAWGSAFGTAEKVDIRVAGYGSDFEKELIANMRAGFLKTAQQASAAA